MSKEYKKVGLGCFGTIFVTFMSILVVVVIAGAIVANMTVARIGLADIKIVQGQSARDLGLADTKIKDVYAELTDIINSFGQNEEQLTEALVDEKAVPTEEDKTAADDMFEGSSINGESGSSGSETDYKDLLNGKITFTVKKQLVLTDTQLAYIFNSVLQGSVGDANIAALSSLKAQVRTVEIESVGNDIHLITVLSVNISDFSAQINQSLGGFIKIQDVMMLTVTNKITGVDSAGIIQTAPISLKINNMSAQAQQLVFNVVLSQMGNGADQLTEDDLTIGVGQLLSQGIGNMGKVGIYDGVVEDITFDAIIPATRSGDSRTAGVIKLITYTETEV